MRSNVLSKRKPGSAMALAIALACGTAVAAVGLAEPAFAQKKKKKKGDDAEYSKEFIAAYNPLNTAMNEGGADIASLRPQIDALLAMANSPDERLATGNLAYNAGAQSNDRGLQLAGMEMMLSSNKLTIENQPQYNFVAYQLSNALGDQAKARTYLQKAIDLNFSNEQISPDELRAQMAESYFREERLVEGLAYLKDAIEAREATGSAAPETWYRRGMVTAYNNEIQPQVYDFTVGWVKNYPSDTNWRDAVNITRNLNTFEAAEILDLMRLAFKLDTMNNKQDYIEYVEAADARRLPKEVADVIEHGYSTGRASRDDIYLADSLSTAKNRIAADRSELPSLERDARAASAGLRTVVAAGDAFLNYSEYAKAEEFYAKALTMPGVETAEVATRLGIAQAKQGKNADAASTFALVEGKRKPIAMLWSAHVSQQATPAVAAPAPAEPEAEPATGG
ncbi:hypothetical protein [Altererythrobacter lutimaris]|uniref:Tetratricopeptide repeat protein n=1 Tax=Altererythrobacter lutimaris TaxID=2743979 RepID=A0A850H802_9SPHN|nr:hypothetical protein [Altererythrobacter lutimaris]NVE94003.1 hypothetical protein [Altererythrobacter lutimaris]